MGALRERMAQSMQIRHLSPKTITAYLYHVREYTKHFGKSPDQLGEEQVRQYLHYLAYERKTSWSNVNVAYSALRYFYRQVLHRPWQVAKIPRPKGEKRLPAVLSKAEARSIIAAVDNLKHRTILATIYASGLRISEACHLRVRDIESGRMMLRVEQGKGKKDRYTLLGEKNLELLREYYRAYRPQEWLFYGQDKGQPINPGTVQRVFQAAKKKPGSLNRPAFTRCGTALPRIY